MTDAEPTTPGKASHIFHAPTLDLYYRPEMAVAAVPQGNFSRSPSKTRRFVAHLAASSLGPHILQCAEFPPLGRDDFLLAQTPGYVDGFFTGQARAPNEQRPRLNRRIRGPGALRERLSRGRGSGRARDTGTHRLQPDERLSLRPAPKRRRFL